VCYMILVEDNRPADVMAVCAAMGLQVGHQYRHGCMGHGPWAMTMFR
jgi:hypothetical protein